MPIQNVLNIRYLLALILGAGLIWLAVNVLTEGDPESNGTVFERIDAYVEDQMDGSRIPGVAIAIVEGGEIVHARGFGNDSRGNDVTPQTPFWIGSNTKSFTALATMQLVEAGLVELDAPVQRYLPEFRVADEVASSQITVRHLLNQTSGFSRADGIAMVTRADDQTLEQAVEELRDFQLNRPVGESFEYSNANFVVLGLLIQRVSGQTWQAYIQEHIFDAVGMPNSYTTLSDARANGLTRTHLYWFGFPRGTEGTYLEGLASTGYLYSSAEDMARYLSMYLQGGTIDGNRLLSEQGIAEMFTPGPTDRDFEFQGRQFTARYGMGWFIGPFGAADDAVWHGGTLPHFIAWIVLLPETDQAVVALVNASHQLPVAGANQVFVRIPIGIVDILRGESPPTGLSLARFYIVFDTLVLMVLTVQVWSFVRVIRGQSLKTETRKPLVLAPFLWEAGGSLVILALFVMSWPAISASIPDVTWTLVAIALLWLATGVARARWVLSGSN